MVVGKNINAPAVSTGTSSIPVWKRLGYASLEDYMKASGIPSTVNGNGNLSNASKNYGGNAVGNKSSAANAANEALSVTEPPALSGVSKSYGGNVTGSNSGTADNTVSGTEPSAGSGVSGTRAYSYNSEANFRDWYKKNYGYDFDASVGLKRPSGMNDGVWNAGNILYTYYLQELEDENQREAAIKSSNDYYDGQAEMLVSNYGTAEANLDKSRKNLQQTASITYDKLKKYLPTQIKAQGLGGLGVSESTMLQAQTNYTNEMSEIERAYSEDTADLASSKQSTLGELEKYRTDAIENINDTYDSKARTRENNAMSGASAEMSRYNNERAEAYNESYERAMEDVDKLSFTSQEEMDAYIERYRGKMTDAQYNALLSRGRTRVSVNISAEENATKQAQYATVETNLEAMYNGMIGEDEKISQTDYNKLEAYVNENGASLGDGYRAKLNTILNGYKQDIRDADAQAKLDKQNALLTPEIVKDIVLEGNYNTANGEEGDNFKISYGDTVYRVEKGKNATDALNNKLVEKYALSAGKVPDEGAVMVYNGKIYMYLESGESDNKGQMRWCIVQQRRSSYHTDFKKLCDKLEISTYSRGYIDAEKES